MWDGSACFVDFFKLTCPLLGSAKEPLALEIKHSLYQEVGVKHMHPL